MPISHRASLAIALVACAHLPCAQASPQSHCGPHEVTYFSCKIKGSEKLVSLCGSAIKDRSGNLNASAWLQYRFGLANKPELIFPAYRKNSLAKFKGEYHSGQSVSSQVVGFKNQGVAYTVGTTFSALTKEGFEGVTVSVPKQKTVSLPCASAPAISSELSTLVSEALEFLP